jgi:hypothetical protein
MIAWSPMSAKSNIPLFQKSKRIIPMRDILYEQEIQKHIAKIK